MDMTHLFSPSAQEMKFVWALNQKETELKNATHYFQKRMDCDGFCNLWWYVCPVEMTLFRAPNWQQHCHLWPLNTLVHTVQLQNTLLTHQEGFLISWSKRECVYVVLFRGVSVSFRGRRLQQHQNPAQGVLAGWGHWGNSWLCSLLEAPVANTFPPVTQSHVRQENENCYCSGSLHLNRRGANFQWRRLIHRLSAGEMSNM